MSEAELLLVNNADGCTIYTIQFLSESDSEFERFYTRFKDDAEYNPDLMRIVALINKIADMGALERYFRPEGKLKDGVCALPVLQSKLRLYCLRLSDKILVLGNGGIKKTRTYNEDCHEDMGTAGWLLEQFKYFLKACGYANETVDKLIFLGYGEKVINANGEVIYEYK